MLESRCDIFRSSKQQRMVQVLLFIFFHNTPILIVSLIAHFFQTLGEFLQKSSDNSRVTYIAFLNSAYMIFFTTIYIYEVPVVVCFYLLQQSQHSPFHIDMYVSFFIISLQESTLMSAVATFQPSIPSIIHDIMRPSVEWLSIICSLWISCSSDIFHLCILFL